MKANAGALTNFEVLDLLNSRGASKDTTRVIASETVSRSEYKVSLSLSCPCDLYKRVISES